MSSHVANWSRGLDGYRTKPGVSQIVNHGKIRESQVTIVLEFVSQWMKPQVYCLTVAV